MLFLNIDVLNMGGLQLWGRAVARIFQRGGAGGGGAGAHCAKVRVLTRLSIMLFSPPVVGCLLRIESKVYKRGIVNRLWRVRRTDWKSALRTFVPIATTHL